MKTSVQFPESGVDPTAPLEAPFHWLVQAGEHMVFGALLGYFATSALRALGLRWTWSALGVGAVALAGGLLGPAAWPVGIASAYAAYRSRKAERDDLRAGGVKLYGPIDALRVLRNRIALRRRMRSGQWLRGYRLLVGVDGDCNAIEVPLQSHAGGANTLMTGAAGSGKTVMQAQFSMGAIQAGMGTLVIDPKDDPELCERVRAAARAAGAPLFEWSPEGPCVYNPYAGGTESEIADKALAGEHFTEPHYQRQAQRYLSWEVRILRAAGVQISLAGLAEYLDPDRLELVLRQLPEADAARGYEYLDSLSARQRSDLGGVRDRLSILAESDVGPWLDPQTAGVPTFDLHSCLTDKAVVLFRLCSDRRPLIMQMLGGAIVLDLLTVAARMQQAPVPSLAVIDEFAALAAPHMGDLFARTRGAGISLVLSTQEISDLQLAGRETLRDQVANNLTTTIAYRQVNPESAEWICKLAGKEAAWRPAISNDGRYTYTPEQRPLLVPRQITTLAPGQAAVIGHGPGGRVSIARMFRAMPSSR